MEEKNNSIYKKAIIFLLCLVTIVFVSIMGTYAYFMVNISNNDRQEVQLDIGTMRLRFADGSGRYSMENTSYYLYNPNADSWTISPFDFEGLYAKVVLNNRGYLLNSYTYNEHAISPVINLKLDYFKNLIGDGTMTNPFRTV